MNEVVIVSGSRDRCGRLCGSLKSTSVVTLGATVMHETLRKAACVRLPVWRCARLPRES